MNSGVTLLMSNDNTWTISVVPTLAPSMMARAGTRPTVPSAASDVVINPVAVLPIAAQASAPTSCST